jgi:HlyD family secretion protein
VAAAKGKVVAKVTASGTLSALVTVQVGSQVSGRVSEILADFNSPVKKGQVIARIDPQPFEAALAQARANTAAARANLNKAKVQASDADHIATRQKALLADKLIAQQDYDTATATADAARAQVAAADAALAQAVANEHQAEINLGYATITSPIDGTVISRSVDAGQTVASALQAPTLFTIAQDLTKMQVDSSVAEGDVGRLQAGMTASFTVDAFPNEVFQGTVRQVRNAPQTVQNVVTYDAVIDVDNPQLKLKPGMTANVTFVVAQADDATLVPNAALRFRPQQTGDKTPRQRPTDATAAPRDPNQKSIWVLRGLPPTLTRVKVTLGVTDGNNTQITGGELQPGDQIVTDVREGSPAPQKSNGSNNSPGLTGNAPRGGGRVL